MLNGKNVILRSLEKTDLNFLAEIENNQENWEFGSERKIFSKDELLFYIKNAKIDIQVAKQYRFVIEFRGAVIGFVDIFDYNNNSAGVGIIVVKEYRGMGFAKESLRLIIDYAFTRLKLNYLYARIKRSNLLSINLFSSCGFAFKKEESGLQYFIKLAQK